jgi:hypothetical protein
MREAGASGSIAPDGLKLVVAPNGHLEPAESVDEAPATVKRAAVPAVVSPEEAALNAANRARIAALRNRRYGAVNGLGDVFVPPARLMIAVGIAVAAKILVGGRVLPLGVGLTLLVACLATLVALMSRQRRRDQRAVALRESAEAAARSPTRHHGGVPSPRQIVNRARRGLDAVPSTTPS